MEKLIIANKQVNKYKLYKLNKPIWLIAVLQATILVLTIGITSGSSLHSQTIKLVRTDVDSSRSSFVTANYLFGFDVVVDSIKNCSGVTFELSYNFANEIEYSEYQTGDFGDEAATVVVPVIDKISGTGRLYVGVTSGETIDSASIDNPRVIHIDFAVRQNAVNASQLRFNFISAYGIVKSDTGGGKVVDLISKETIYNIHGFINVWPGDADNNSVVDNKDLNQIILFLGYGSATKNLRSFKRPSASTIWVPQRVLAWDSASVSYADCDGNGDITVQDMLVVPLNFQKQHFSASKSGNEVQSSSNVFITPDYSPSATMLPYYIYDSQVIAISGEFEIQNGELLGVLPSSSIDSDNGFSYYHNSSSSIEFVQGFLNSESTISTSIPAFHLLVKSDNPSRIEPTVKSLTALTKNGNIYPLNAVLNVEDALVENSHPRLILSDGFLRIVGTEGSRIESIVIFNSIGIKIAEYRSSQILSGGVLSSVLDCNTLAGNSLTQGAYYSAITTNLGTYIDSFIILK